jgi:hypothetical protein
MKKAINNIFENLVKQYGKATLSNGIIYIKNTNFKELRDVLNSINSVYQYQPENDDDGEQIESNWFAYDFYQDIESDIEYQILVLETDVINEFCIEVMK